MTISSTSSRVVYSGDGTTSSFGFAFYVSDQADLVVTYTDAAGNQTVIAPGVAPTGYQISAPAVPAPGWPAGGTIAYNPGSPIAAGTTLTIQRVVAGTQPTTLSNQGAFWPQVIEKALDRVVTIVQGFIDQVSLSLRISPADVAALNPLPPLAVRKNTVLGFDANGQPVAVTLTTSIVAVGTWVLNNLLPQSSRVGALGALGAAGTADNNTYTGSNNFQGGSISGPTRVLGDSSKNMATTEWATSYLQYVMGGVVSQSNLSALQLSNDGVSPNSVIDVSAGACADSTTMYQIKLAAFTKSTAGSWVAASGQNGMGQGLTIANNTWYHVFAIFNGTTDDVYFDTSISAANHPPGYTAFRRIGSFLTDGSAHIIPFVQSGDRFDWLTPVSTGTLSPASTAAQDATLNIAGSGGVPLGVATEAILSGLVTDATSANTILYVSSKAQTDVAPSTSNLTAQNPSTTANGVFAGLRVMTDTNQKVRYRLGTTTATARFNINGWIDRRGRDN